MEYCIRPYVENDAEQIGTFNKVLELSYRYHQDFDRANIFCAVTPSGDIAACAHLEYHDTWWSMTGDEISPNFIYKIQAQVSVNDAVIGADKKAVDALRWKLLTTLITRGREIRQAYPDKNIRLFVWLPPEEFTLLDTYIGKGFTVCGNSLVLKRDLLEPIVEVPCPEGVKVERNFLDTEASLVQYHAAETKGFDGINRSLNTIRWLMNAPEWADFSALSGNEVVGGVMTWSIDQGRSATEDIFVAPEWRGRGVAKYAITTTLKYLRDNGKEMATLSVGGRNKVALQLYYSLGYRMFGSFFELGLDI